MKIYNGKSLTQWSKKTGIKRDTLRARIYRMGMSIEEAVSLPVNRSGIGSANWGNGEKFNGKTLTEWSRETGIKQDTLYKRVHRQGLSIEDALNIPVERGNPDRWNHIIKESIGESNDDSTPRKSNKKAPIQRQSNADPTLDLLKKEHQSIISKLDNLNQDLFYSMNPKTIKRSAKQKIRLIKSKKEIEALIKLESNGDFKREKYRKGFIYVIELYDDNEFFYKVGISSAPPDTKTGRWKQIESHYTLGEFTFYQECKNFAHARQLESAIKSKTIPYQPAHLFNGWTECFVY